MNSGTIRWRGQPVPFREGQSIATALLAAGIVDLGTSGPTATRYFCGIGACQGCAVRVDGVVREACITPAALGAAVEPLEPSDPAS